VGRLPSERILCRETGVSRPKLREALAILENEKVLVTRDRARFIRSVNRRAANASRVVRLLTPLDFVEMQQHEQIWLDHLRGLLAAKDYQLQLLVKPALFKTRTRKVLESLGSDTACWLLHRSTRPLQQELVRSAVPVLVVGSVYEGIALNSVDVDHRAACRHAVGMLCRAGHREIYWLGTRSTRAGDLLSEAGFLEGVKADGRNRIMRHDGTDAGVCRALDNLLLRKPRATAYVISNSNHTLTAICHLARRGLVAGRDYALIARESAPFFDHVLPSIARYSQIPEKMAGTAAALIFKLVSGAPAKAIQRQIMPGFISGESLVPVNSLASALERKTLR
jgi:LacI family transcriptional regulator